jgi:hypothetical protein
LQATFGEQFICGGFKFRWIVQGMISCNVSDMGGFGGGLFNRGGRNTDDKCTKSIFIQISSSKSLQMKLLIHRHFLPTCNECPCPFSCWEDLVQKRKRRIVEPQSTKLPAKRNVPLPIAFMSEYQPMAEARRLLMFFLQKHIQVDRTS